jgi:hypothetical protein
MHAMQRSALQCMALTAPQPCWLYFKQMDGSKVQNAGTAGKTHVALHEGKTLCYSSSFQGLGPACVTQASACGCCRSARNIRKQHCNLSQAVRLIAMQHRHSGNGARLGSSDSNVTQETGYACTQHVRQCSCVVVPIDDWLFTCTPQQHAKLLINEELPSIAQGGILLPW